MALSEYMKTRQAAAMGLSKPVESKPVYQIPKVSAKQREKIKAAAPGKKELNDWFVKIQGIESDNGNGCRCMECNAFIPEHFIRHAIAHLLPKKLFHSVATNDLNYLILGAGCGCHDKTHTAAKFVKMRVWPEAKDRIKQMLPLLPANEYKHISVEILKALEV